MNESNGTDLNQALRKQLDLLGSANRALEKQNENLHRRVEHLRKQLREKGEEAARLKALTERMAAALGFYASSASYRPGQDGPLPIERDGGKFSREVLVEWSLSQERKRK